MSDLAVITPSFRGDAELFHDLHRSVLRYTPAETVHHVLVPPGDRSIFGRYEGPRCRVWASSQFLPRRYLRIGAADNYVNLLRPWPPVRGWIAQQAVKIAAAATLDADVVLVMDSDVVLVRPVTADRFTVGGRPLLYRQEGGVTADLRRHVIWHRVARELLGLPAAPPPPLPDYVSSFNFWRPAVVRAMQERISQTTGRHWLDAFTGQLHISEFMLYGVFVDEVAYASTPCPTESTVCHNTWQTTPLDHAEALAFVEKIAPEAVAMMISAKSRTPLDVRRAAIRRCVEITDPGSDLGAGEGGNPNHG